MYLDNLSICPYHIILDICFSIFEFAIVKNIMCAAKKNKYLKIRFGGNVEIEKYS